VCSQEFRRNAFNTDSVDEALDLLDFCYKIVARSGLSEVGTYLPKAIHPKYNCIQPKTSIDDAMEEAQMVICGAIEGLLKKQGEFALQPSAPLRWMLRCPLLVFYM